jgi:hypothetical protein
MNISRVIALTSLVGAGILMTVEATRTSPSTATSTAPSTPSTLTTGSGQAVTEYEPKEKMQDILLNPNPPMITALKAKASADRLDLPKDIVPDPAEEHWIIMSKMAASFAASVKLVRTLAPNVAKEFLDPWVDEQADRDSYNSSKLLENTGCVFIVSRLLMAYAALDSDHAIKSDVHDIVAGLLIPFISRRKIPVINRRKIDLEAAVYRILPADFIADLLDLAAVSYKSPDLKYLNMYWRIGNDGRADSLIPKARILKKFVDEAAPAPVQEFGYKWRDLWTFGGPPSTDIMNYQDPDPSDGSQDALASKWYQLSDDEWKAQALHWYQGRGKELCESGSITKEYFDDRSMLEWSRSFGDKWRRQLSLEFNQLLSDLSTNSSQMPQRSLVKCGVEHVFMFTTAVQ